MKTDNYLTLCLEQAAKSPLHYRHGAIVVRGGKVIGTGYNAYRPGFDGGALKHGRIANGGLDGDPIAALKLKMKALKQKDKNQQDHPQQQSQSKSQSTFVPVETTSRGGGGPNVNTPLSMHSEMMAIHSALAASATLSSTAFSREKPCFKLPRGDKRKSRLRADVLRAYVAQVRQERDNNNKNVEEESAAGCAPAEMDSAFHASRSGVKHHWKKNWKGKHQKRNQYEAEYHHQYEYEAAHGQQQPQPSACRGPGRREHPSGIRGYDATIGGADEVGVSNAAVAKADMPSGVAASRGKRGKDYKRVGVPDSPSSRRTTNAALQSGKMRGESSLHPQQPMLLPVGRVGEAGHSVAERKKSPRLRGADLYVTRMGWSGAAERKEKKKKQKATGPVATPVATPSCADPADNDFAESVCSLSSLSLTSTNAISPPIPSSSSTSGGYASLHEEYLANCHSLPSVTACCDAEGLNSNPPVSASRPCYRCISFMHAVGIRRVFWTNDSGGWEGGKVKDLVDGIDGVATDGANGGLGGGGPMGNGVFVTKHEVIMMRRIMGAQSAANGGAGASKRKRK